MSRRSSAPRNQLLVDFSETDLNKLQGQYHRTEGAKRAYTKKTKGLIFRDKEEIERLQHEREEHLRSLRVSQSSFNRWTDASVVQDLTAKLACRDRIDEELEAEKAKVASLKDQILKWERKLAGQKNGQGTTQLTIKLDKGNLQRRTCLIENKLHRGHKCFNEMMTRNGELREELKILQVERKQFLHVQSRLEKELHAIQKVISNLRTKCTEAFNASVNIQERQRMLTGQNDKDVTQYIKEKSNLEREMSRSRNFEAFLDIKAVARTHRRKVKYKQLESTELGQEDFEEAIKKILTETEESDLDKLVRNFIQMEEQNYTLLKFVNYQQSEAETIRRQISQLCKERAIFVAEEQRQQEQHQALRKKISIKQEEIEKQLGGYQHRVDVFEKLLDQLKDGVKSLLQISYESSVIQLVSSDGGEDENIVESLRRVENRVNELLALQSFLHFQENVEQWDIDSLSTIAVQLLGKNPPAVNLNTVAATSAPGDDPNVVESVLLEANGPVNRNDLLTLVNKRIQRRRKTD
ncbi:outer dynein arm-docking complex subunit 1-like isoform X1 [Centropristis striata]|uniref:outer dynein arm-docking complex subunit 1-like isoform X1 n=1 Tax=Centropristis striata TaxID=184440 RepID=UPI0027E208D3|nr:outer dynein arm-docking complex subunit 1-like isoform X1 [Centropristis striata]XP_059189622.1 outer dynein arm-docking complex subunit 1-like isoform X1 [Centropristis striata]XP_059189623.1 outer dynein arm-docking complex subunit 1-like isoform X1 [Centropristis striata]